MKKFLALMLSLALTLSLVACGGTQETVSETTIEKVAAGSTITTDFVDITITESGLANDLRTTITTADAAKIVGPYDSAETDYAYIRGTIINKTASDLKNEITVNVNAGGKLIEEFDICVYDANGETVFDLSPDTEYNFIMCAELENELLAGIEECSFNFGFNENMEYSFKKVEEMDYKYSVTITQ